MAEYRSNKREYAGFTFDSEKELQFFREYLEGHEGRVEVHPNYRVTNQYTLGGYKFRGRFYKPDFVVYDKRGEIAHVYDVKASISPKVDSKGKQKTPNVFINPAMRKSIDDFQRLHRIPVELVVPMKGRFRMTILGPTIPLGVFEFDSIDYDITEVIGK